MQTFDCTHNNWFAGAAMLAGGTHQPTNQPNKKPQKRSIKCSNRVIRAIVSALAAASFVNTNLVKRFSQLQLCIYCCWNCSRFCSGQCNCSNLSKRRKVPCHARVSITALRTKQENKKKKKRNSNLQLEQQQQQVVARCSVFLSFCWLIFVLLFLLFHSIFFGDQSRAKLAGPLQEYLCQ